ncbi:MAG: hypothetical protein DRP11_01415 [Candidatus Aenigmatarchaeota archaeon]|nr:MAG: hypothetical protein DRP11_01415 [Candidatus Aenigmarchaeota archaeon]
MWIKYKMHELDPKAIDVTMKRFKGQKVLLYELIDCNRYIIVDFFKECENELDVINKVIKEIKYPLTSDKKPTDFHYFQAFKKWWWTCHKSFRNNYDYWQFASETAWLRMGDCEDSSILTGAGLEWFAKDYFIALGRVLRYGRLLGYHAWVIVNMYGAWRLVETTLDTPYSSPLEIPPIDIEKNKWQVGKLTYEALILFNRRELWVWSMKKSNSEKPEDVVRKALVDYMKRSHKEKESKIKYHEMHKSYMELLGKGIKVK